MNMLTRCKRHRLWALLVEVSTMRCWRTAPIKPKRRRFIPGTFVTILWARGQRVCGCGRLRVPVGENAGDKAAIEFGSIYGAPLKSLGESSVVPPGLDHLLLSFPALKRWAIFGRPFGTGFWRGARRARRLPALLLPRESIGSGGRKRLRSGLRSAGRTRGLAGPRSQIVKNVRQKAPAENGRSSSRTPPRPAPQS